MRLLGFFFMLLIVVFIMGLWLDWFDFSTRKNGQGDKVDLTLKVDKDKIKDDTADAANKVSELGQRAKEKVAGTETVKGELVRVQENQAMIVTAENNAVTVQTMPSTKVLKQEKEITLTDLKQGDRVTVVYKVEEGKKLAQSITVEPRA